MVTVQRMKELCEQQLNAFAAGDWNTYKAGLTDAATYEEEATGRRAQGPDAIVQAVEPWKRAFPDVKVTIREAIGSGDALVVELEWTGTHLGPLVSPFGTIPATRKAGNLLAVQVVRFDGEKIREVRHYFDILSLLRQMGVAPRIGAAAAQP